jgi:hypothetical protein
MIATRWCSLGALSPFVVTTHTRAAPRSREVTAASHTRVSEGCLSRHARSASPTRQRRIPTTMSSSNPLLSATIEPDEDSPFPSGNIGQPSGSAASGSGGGGGDSRQQQPEVLVPGTQRGGNVGDEEMGIVSRSECGMDS